MRFLITGGTGFIGSLLVKQLLIQNQQNLITVLSRQQSKSVRMSLGTKVVPIQTLESIGYNSIFDVIINLSGEAILDKRWNQKRKKELLDSRIKVTENIFKLIGRLKIKPKCFISASATGYYGYNSNKELTEEKQSGTGFAASLCYRWEQQANKISELGIRTCIIRMPPVLHESGGMMQSILPFYRLGLGFIIGTGKQDFPWVHVDDVIAAINFFIEKKNIKGTYNLAAPELINNKEFSKTIAKIITRPLFLKIPGFLLLFIKGESAKILLQGNKISSKKLISAGFNFKYSNITAALKNIFRRS